MYALYLHFYNHTDLADKILPLKKIKTLIYRI